VPPRAERARALYHNVIPGSADHFDCLVSTSSCRHAWGSGGEFCTTNSARGRRFCTEMHVLYPLHIIIVYVPYGTSTSSHLGELQSLY
jgi:hypothetical protein